MKDTLIEFKTAKLAKEKGFKSDTYIPGHRHEGDVGDFKGFYFPTQSLLQKWLREEYKIDIEIRNLREVEQGIKLYKYGYISIVESEEKRHKQYNTFSETYEEALEIALYEALKLIK